MARRRKIEPAISRYEIDETLKGTQVRIKGERGIYTILKHEFNPRNGKHWFALWGGPNKQYRDKHPSQVTPAKRGAKLEY